MWHCQFWHYDASRLKKKSCFIGWLQMSTGKLFFENEWIQVNQMLLLFTFWMLRLYCWDQVEMSYLASCRSLEFCLLHAQRQPLFTIIVYLNNRGIRWEIRTNAGHGGLKFNTVCGFCIFWSYSPKPCSERRCAAVKALVHVHRQLHHECLDQ